MKCARLSISLFETQKPSDLEGLFRVLARLSAVQAAEKTMKPKEQIAYLLSAVQAAEKTQPA